MSIEATALTALAARMSASEEAPIAITVDAGGNGTLPGGHVAYKRTHPTWDDSPYVVHIWYLDPNGTVAYGNGSYDLTFEDALKVFKERARI